MGNTGLIVGLHAPSQPSEQVVHESAEYHHVAPPRTTEHCEFRALRMREEEGNAYDVEITDYHS